MKLSLPAFLFIGLLSLSGLLHAAGDEVGEQLPAVTDVLSLAKLGRGADLDRLPWDKQEKALRWSYIALSAIDTYQTMRFPDGFSEGNPLLGKQPGDVQIVAFKAATTWGLLELTDRYARKHKTRKTILWLINSIQLSVDVHNESITGGIIF